MEYIQTNNLNEKQQADILALQDLCFSPEKLSNKPFLSNELNCNKEIPCFFLAYENQTLISFLTCFIPSPVEAEVNGFTHPHYRHRGLFSSLLALSSKTLKPFGYDRFILQVEPKSKEGMDYVTNHCPDIERTEYRLSMTTQGWEHTVKTEPKGITLERVTTENLPIYARISATVFNESLEQSTAYITTIVHNEEREASICYYEGTPIGVFNVHYEEKDFAILYGIGIIPQYRGKGLGKNLVSLALASVFEKVKTVYLDVDSENPKAYALYLSLGFSISFQVNYHTLLLA
jgi:ribosomal protein S18 acetylase RimI-like enzyme